MEMKWISPLFSRHATKEVLPLMTDSSLDMAQKQTHPLDSDAVSMDKALEIFDQLADRGDIAFGYSRDGCYARAHIMCRILIDMGLSPKKAWAFEENNPLCVQKPNGKTVQWRFHVTAALPVDMPDGSVQDMVIDPGLFDGPVSLKEWGDIMQAPPENLQIVPFGVAPKNHDGDYNTRDKTTPETDERAAEKMKDYLKFQDAAPRQVFQSQSRQQISQKQVVQSQGATWVSVKKPNALQRLAQTALNM